MSHLAKVGECTYEFETFGDLTDARAIYSKPCGDQNSFEDAMEEAGLDFMLDINDVRVIERRSKNEQTSI